MGWESQIALNVYLESLNLNTQGFGGTLLFTNDVTYDTETYKKFTDPDSLSDDSEVGSTAKAIGEDWFGVDPHGEKLLIGKATDDGGGDINSTEVSNDLDDIVDAVHAAGEDFWAIICSSKTQDVLEAIATWAASKNYLPVLVTADEDVKNDVASNVAENLAGDDRQVLLIYHDTSDEYPDAELVALKTALDTESTDSGHTRWEYTAVGVTGQDSLSSTEIANITSNNCNIFLTTAGEVVLGEGKCSSGDYPDEILTKHWLEARLQEAILGLMIRESTANRAVRYDKHGFSQMSQAINNVLQLCVDTKKASSFSFDWPKRGDATASDAENQIYRFTATVTMSGGIVQVAGNVYLSR